MRALVVYESMFGNARAVGDAIAGGLSEHVRVDAAEVGELSGPVPDDVTLLVLGGPTHAFGMSRPETRAEAYELATLTGRPGTASAHGIREWLDGVGPGLGRLVATYDTRFHRHCLNGAASADALEVLQRLGFDVSAGRRSFFVKDMTGPLCPGELERAARWGGLLASQAGYDCAGMGLVPAR